MKHFVQPTEALGSVTLFVTVLHSVIGYTVGRQQNSPLRFESNNFVFHKSSFTELKTVQMWCLF